MKRHEMAFLFSVAMFLCPVFVTPGQAAPIRESPAKQAMLVIALQHANANDVADIIKQVYEGDRRVSAAVEMSSNRIALESEASLIPDIRELIQKIEESSAVQGKLRLGGRSQDVQAVTDAIRIIKGLPPHGNPERRKPNP
jgi:Bacterial type II/III secretion system short domain